MLDDSRSRRTVLKTIGAAVAGAVSLPGTAAAASGWSVAASPVEEDLYDVVSTADGAYAVGTAGVVIERTADGWTKIIDGGPGGNGNSHCGADVTDDGERLWFVGASGAVGEYDVSTGTLSDHSHPLDSGNNFNGVAVTGTAGEANVYVAGDSGKVYYSVENGADETWNVVTPGIGSAINAVDFFDAESGAIVDGNQEAFSTDDGGTWDRFGIADANVNLYGVDADGFEDVWVCAGGATVFLWNGGGWTPTDLGDAGLPDIEVSDDDRDGYTVGDGGVVFARSDGTWSRDTTPTGENLRAVARGSPTIAVGDGGTVIEGN